MEEWADERSADESFYESVGFLSLSPNELLERKKKGSKKEEQKEGGRREKEKTR